MADSHVRLTSGKWEVELYGPPNKALAGILMGDKLATIVGDYTKKVAATYQSMISTRSTGKPDGGLASTVRAMAHPNDGYRGDRWVGEVTVGDEDHPYGAADEYGRNKYAPYSGSNQLEDALRIHLPYKP